MKFFGFTILASLVLTNGVLAKSAAERSRAFAQLQLEKLQHLTENLTVSINNWKDLNDLSYLLNNVNNPAVAEAAAIADSTRELKQYNTTYGLTQAFRVATYVQDLAYAVNNSIAALNKKMPAILTLGADLIAVGALTQLKNNAEILAEVLLNNVPKKLKPIAINLRSQVLDSLTMGLECAQKKNSSCSTVSIDPMRTHKLALAFGAIRNDGTPIA